MALINIGIAGCLGKMGQELVKEIAHNELINFAGGFWALVQCLLKFHV